MADDADRYIRRGLALIRVANRLDADVTRELERLASDIRALLAERHPDRMTRRELRALLVEIETAIREHYDAIADDQEDAAGILIATETDWTSRAFDTALSATAVAGIVSGLLVLGSRIRDHWRKQAADLAFRISADIRNEVATPSDEPMVRIVDRPIKQAGRRASGIVDATVQSSTNDSRIAVFRKTGIRFFEWNAILDPRVCPVCAIRAGKLWTTDDPPEPIGHPIPLGALPPAHPWCRCILIPHRGAVPDDVTPFTRKFQDWLDSLTREEQDRLLGVGRADLYRRGVITLADLIDQRGRLLTLDELRELA